MHTKHKGTLAEAKVIADLYEKGLAVALVVDDLCPFDLIAIDAEHNLYKVQVKYSKFTKRNVAILRFRSCMSNKNLSYTKRYSKSEVDIFALYVPDLNQCYYIKSNILDTHCELTLRNTIPKNNQLDGVHFLDDYLQFPTLICGP